MRDWAGGVDQCLLRWVIHQHLGISLTFCYSRSIHKVIQGKTKEFKLESDERQEVSKVQALLPPDLMSQEQLVYCSAEVKLRKAIEVNGALYNERTMGSL